MLDVPGLKLAPEEATAHYPIGQTVDDPVDDGQVKGVGQPIGTSSERANQKGVVDLIDVVLVQEQAVENPRGLRAFRHCLFSVLEFVGQIES